MAGRRTSLAALAGERVEAIPGHGDPTLTRVQLAWLATTPLNRRSSFDPSKLDELGASLRKRQLQAIVVVPADMYLKLWPDHRDHVGEARYVIVAGERRYRAAQRAGLATLQASIQEDVADSRLDLLDAVVTENLERQNLDPIEEAHAVEDMVNECGGNAAAAAGRFGRSEGWVSQRRSLLKLSPDIQRRVSSGELSVRIARALAGKGLPPEQQAAALHGLIEQQAAEREQRAQTRQARKASQTSASPTSGMPGPRATPDATQGAAEGPFTAVKARARGASRQSDTPVIPLGSPHVIAQALRRHLSASELRTLVALLAS